MLNRLFVHMLSKKVKPARSLTHRGWFQENRTFKHNFTMNEMRWQAKKLVNTLSCLNQLEYVNSRVFSRVVAWLMSWYIISRVLNSCTKSSFVFWSSVMLPQDVRHLTGTILLCKLLLLFVTQKCYLSCLQALQAFRSCLIMACFHTSQLASQEHFCCLAISHSSDLNFANFLFKYLFNLPMLSHYVSCFFISQY